MFLYERGAFDWRVIGILINKIIPSLFYIPSAPRAQSGPEGLEHSRTPSPVPKPAPPTTAPGEPTNDAAEE
jgi:hypothetical protein